jgi:hypothetical protein
MKNSDTRLNRLFQAARAAAVPDEPAPMPDHLKTRILAQWRSSAAVDEFGVMLVGLFRRALVCGALAMAITFVWSYGKLTEEPQNYEDIANYDFRAEELP